MIAPAGLPRMRLQLRNRMEARRGSAGSGRLVVQSTRIACRSSVGVIMNSNGTETIHNDTIDDVLWARLDEVDVD